MALLTDDLDIKTVWLRTILGGNGDYYIETIAENDEGIRTCQAVRICTSGGFAPTEVKIAAANLYRAMETAGLNEFPD